MSDRIRVLHVDDPDLAELTASFLEREDSRIAVETASNATEGLERLADPDAGIDRVVSDHDMPGPNGIELLETVRLAAVVESCWETVETADATLTVEASLARTVAGASRRLPEGPSVPRGSAAWRPRRHAGRERSSRLQPAAEPPATLPHGSL